MLKNEHKIKKQSDFDRLSKKSKAYFGPYCILKIIKNNQAISRFGIIVSNRVSKKAVERNRLKRQYRAMCFLFLSRMLCGYDVLIIIKKQAIGREYSLLEDSLKNLLKTAKLLKI